MTPLRPSFFSALLRRGPVLPALLAAAALAAQERDPFSEHVRSTPPLTPEAERRALHVLEGFEIQLVASEPEIQKPMNLAFDARGRLWVTGSTEYPFPVPPDRKGRDTIKVLEDLDGDGRADRITTFAEGLSIPIGILPLSDGAIAFSIPYIYRFYDRDGDGRAEERRELYGPFGWERDTHGLNNAFRRAFDGWVYACHGFNNESTVRGRDGHEVRMHSGNTYRFRLDGSRIEHFTWGQVNPFGMTFDPYGYLYTADCHSSPLYQLVRGGYYPSFGKPHDGLGFVPPIMRHSHGSTAIAGAAYYEADAFPAEYRGSIFVGNVVTCRVHRDFLERHGSTVKAVEMPDFVVSEDPWFRPVDLQVGPDGALYIADFYNRIIGHYEVPLDHPGRDRYRARIWRVVYKGGGPAARPKRAPDLASLPTEALEPYLAHPNLTARNLATNLLADRGGEEAVSCARKAFERPEPEARAHALWVLERLEKLGGEALARAARDPSPLVRAHAQRVLAERASWSQGERELARGGLRDPDPNVRRAAAEAVGLHPLPEEIQRLLAVLPPAGDPDTYLRHTVRIALRNHLRTEGGFEAARALGRGHARELASVALAVPSEAAGDFLLEYLEGEADRAPPGEADAFLRHAARYAGGASLAKLPAVARRIAPPLDLQYALAQAAREGLRARGSGIPPAIRSWALEIARDFLAAARKGPAGPRWTALPAPGLPSGPVPWDFQERPLPGGGSVRLLSSHPHGEGLTGLLRSPAFALPKRLRLLVAGHDGPPERPAAGRNLVRVRLVEGGAVVAQAGAPRSDAARAVEWDFSADAGRRAVLEVIDSDTNGAYAWIAFGALDPAVVPLPDPPPHVEADRTARAADLAADFGLEELRDELAAHVLDPKASVWSRARASRALLTFRRDPALEGLLPVFADGSTPEALREEIARALAGGDREAARALLARAAPLVPARLAGAIAEALAATREGAAILLELALKGRLAAQAVLAPAIRERISVAGGPEAARKLEELAERTPPASEEAERAIREALRAFERARPDPARGRAVFEKHCAPCHKLGELGRVIGPQLDGIAARGRERLLEDILDPNRAVDVAFRTAAYVLDDGTVVSGLERREEGAAVIVADASGKEIAIPKGRILRKVPGETSLMPADFARVIARSDLVDLLGFLLEAGGGRPPESLKPEASGPPPGSPRRR